MKVIQFVILFSILGSFSSCFIIQETTTTTTTTTDPKEDPSGKVDITKMSAGERASYYIETYKPIAISEMKRTGVPASIKLAQAILESGYGMSELARNAKNHFGIKCGGDWNGKTYELKSKKSCFRAYSSAEESFKHHSDFLKGRSHYASLFKLKRTDYKGWAKGLQKAGYATDPKYPAKLIELIERYDLDKYDKE